MKVLGSPDILSSLSDLDSWIRGSRCVAAIVDDDDDLPSKLGFLFMTEL